MVGGGGGGNLAMGDIPFSFHPLYVTLYYYINNNGHFNLINLLMYTPL